jgi:hypothetical protein
VSAQLGLDGRETPYPVRVPRPLSDMQREVMLFVLTFAPVRPRDVGQIMHAARGAMPKPKHYAADGWSALRRLERRGLVQRVARGKWEPVRRSESW